MKEVHYENTVLEFLNNLWGLGTEQEYVCHTGPPGYTAWRNWFLGIDFWAPSKFKNWAQDASGINTQF